ncbi:MAG: HlyD family secretion protein [Alphaproteobacteria bacterium]|nr:HlyD family secretion protein [Alphaproteobacteria bacterium]
MQDETYKEKKFKRFILLIFIPLMTIMFILGFFYSLGRYITTENAYIKAPIISIQSQIPGRVKTVFVKDNQKVKKGQKLFKIDTAKLKFDLSEQKQNLLTIKKEIDNRKSKYNEVTEEIKLAEEEIKYYLLEMRRAKSLINVEIKLAEEKVKYHQLEFNRIKNLVNKGVGLKSKLDEEQYLYQSAINNLKAVKLNSNFEEIKHSYTSSKQKLKIINDKAKTILTTLNGDAELKFEEHPLYLKHLSKLEQISFDIEQSTIFAEQDGIIAQMNLEEGEYIDIGKVLFAIVDEKNAWLEANLKETELTNIKVNQSAVFTPDAYPNNRWNAKVESISPATGSEFSILPPQNSSGNWVKVVQRVPVKIVIGSSIINENILNNSKKDLRVGMTVSVTIDTKYKRDVPFIIRPFSYFFELF